MAENKNHWYDGWFYDTVIAPNQDTLFGQINSIIEPQSKILDVGCGTGRLAFALADSCESVLGIDLSTRNIDRANRTLQKQPNSKLSFRHSYVSELPVNGQKPFDYAVLTYVIHEVDEEERIPLLNEIAKVADKIIIGDYVFPRTKKIEGHISRGIEFLAGTDHYRNYKSYMKNGGIAYLAKKAGLTIVYEINNHSLVNHIVVLEK
ncbi:MAG: class I SAM-dependent methyltransferase [Salinivirgaceae bacterium]